MNNRTAALRSPIVLITGGVAILILLIWLVAWFFPQGSKLSKLHAQEATLQTQIAQGNAKVALLKRQALNTPALLAMSKQLNSYVPATADVYPYIKMLSDTATAAGVTPTNLSPSAPSKSASAGNFTVISISMTVKAPYDNLLTFIRSLYALPRLTTIVSVAMSGGGPSTTRSTPLTAVFSLQTYTTATPTA